MIFHMPQRVNRENVVLTYMALMIPELKTLTIWIDRRCMLRYQDRSMEPGLHFEWAALSDPVSQASWYHLAHEDHFVLPKTRDEMDYTGMELVRYKDKIQNLISVSGGVEA